MFLVNFILLLESWQDRQFFIQTIPNVELKQSRENEVQVRKSEFKLRLFKDLVPFLIQIESC